MGRADRRAGGRRPRAGDRLLLRPGRLHGRPPHRPPRNSAAAIGRTAGGTADKRKECSMTPTDERSGEPDERALTRKQFVTRTVGAALAGSTIVSGAARAATYRTAATARAAKGKVVIGAFVDGGLLPFKDKIIPLFQRAHGIKLE